MIEAMLIPPSTDAPPATGSSADQSTALGLVVIGRNEGQRLVQCLKSVRDIPFRVYVDSGSTDGSPEAAAALGCAVVPLSRPPAFTAARARNAGIAHLRAAAPSLRYIQVVDGDCELEPGWLAAGIAALEGDATLGAVFGRRRERFPERSIYNALCDREWDVALGEAGAFGGDVLFRADALAATSGYPEDMIAGEDPDLSMRLRLAGWRIARIDAPMTRHDAALLRFRQWWRRTLRGGHAFAELAERHPGSRWPDWRRQCRSIVVWGGLYPALVVATLLAGFAWSPAWIATALLVLLWPAQVFRLAIKERRAGLPPRLARASGLFLMLGKVAEFAGIARFAASRALRRSPQLIEYKGPATMETGHGR